MIHVSSSINSADISIEKYGITLVDLFPILFSNINHHFKYGSLSAFYCFQIGLVHTSANGKSTKLIYSKILPKVKKILTFVSRYGSFNRIVCLTRKKDEFIKPVSLTINFEIFTL